MPATAGPRKRNLVNVSDQASPASTAPSLAALRQARATRETLLRRVLPVGLGALVIVVVATSRAKPGAGLHGASLGVTLALAGFALAAVAGFCALVVRRGTTVRPIIHGRTFAKRSVMVRPHPNARCAR